jgi:hypothetical protein
MQPIRVLHDERIDGGSNIDQPSEVDRQRGSSGRNVDGNSGDIDLSWRGRGNRSLADGIIEQDRAREGKLGGIGEGQRLWSTAETSVHGGDRHPVIEVRDARVHRIE